MASLPFVVQPRRQPIIELVGSEDSGQIEIERRGYLTTGEKSFVQQVQQFDNGSNEIITLSRQVARRHGLGMDRAYNTVVGIISGGYIDESQQDLVNEIEQEFAEELTAVVKGLAAGQAREELIFAACLIKYRVNENFEIEEISKIHPDIISGLAELYRDEEQRAVEAFIQKELTNEVVSVEEAEKKQSKPTTSRSKSTTGD